MRQTDKRSSTAILALERAYPKQWAMETEPLTCCPPRLSVFWVGWLPFGSHFFLLPVMEQQGHSLAEMSIIGEERRKTYPLGSISPSSPLHSSPRSTGATFPSPFRSTFTVSSIPHVFAYGYIIGRLPFH